MYRCLECGEEFEEPATHVERHPEIEWGCEHWYECPHCGSTNFEEIEDDEEDYEDD